MEVISVSRELVDNIYYYQLYKAATSNEKENNETRQNTYLKMIEYYISIVTHCLQGITTNGNNKTLQMEYLNYFSWNACLIQSNLEDFEDTLEARENKTANETRLMVEIKKQLEAVKQAKKQFLELDSNELAKVQEYTQAYRIVKNSKNRANKSLVENLSYRFVDYLNTLSGKRCNIDGFGRSVCNFDELAEEAKFILARLNAVNSPTCYQLTQSAWEAFISYRDADGTHRERQDQEIAAALEESHARANESRLQNMERQLKEACEKINIWLQHKLNQSFELLKMATAPLFHPWITLQNLWCAVCNPIDTKDALKKWIKQNTWKAGAITVLGLTVGVSVGLLIGGPLIVGALSMEVACGVVGGFAVGATTILAPLLGAAGEAGLLVKNAKAEMQDQKNKNADDKQKVLDELDPLKRSFRNEEFIRARVKTAKQAAERELAVITRAEEESREQLNYDLSIMSHEQIEPALNECREAFILVTEELTSVKATREKVISNLNEMQRNRQIISDARLASVQIQKIAKETFGDIGVAKRLMSLEQMIKEAEKSELMSAKNLIILSVVLLFIAWYFY